MIPWAELDANRQLQLREDYARDPICLTGTCSLEAKTAHFAAWLAVRSVAFSTADLSPARRSGEDQSSGRS
ncbi:hypothetical protein [Neotabrizicola shimadae]|uniref:Uncharacterized protein n=1 Tax=Neotabrizicola shimadae TaxID=2807096 RepID=A0A8G0ZXV5_9RHOB|nr:hypothetical protein [Neotabrizicola shimadae]QYZ70748.1 hypothetical protein JO391_04335 [Neotabrizicola shimadae]